MAINKNTSLEQLAAIVSQALEAAGIPATLSGGAAVSIYTRNAYQSKDLDFVTAERKNKLTEALAPLGFSVAPDQRHFQHPETDLFVEFPPGPLEFGSTVVQHADIPSLNTQWGALRIVTPTLCVMDRLMAFWAWGDRQSWDQAVMVCASGFEIDFARLESYAVAEAADPSDIARLRQEAGTR